MIATAFQPVYTELKALTKATITLEATGVEYDELAWVDGRTAQVIRVDGDLVTLQVFSGTEGLGTEASVIFSGKAPQLTLSPLLAGRYFNAFGQAIDNQAEVKGLATDVKGATVNPVRRQLPSELLATGIAGIDLNNTLVTGQKIPFFADPDQAYNQILAEVALRADSDRIVLGGMGISHDDFLMFQQRFEASGAANKIVSYINTSEDPPLERLLIPDLVCTTAEYFAIEKNEKVLVLLTDMTLYADALAIVSNKMDQIPSKDAMPGSLYSDLARIYEKAVQFKEGGSITIIAVTTLNDGDISHAIPDNTGYITEGQLYLKRDPETGLTIIDPFRSLSRLKQNVIGTKTREDHPQVMNALVRLYADAAEARSKKENGFDLNEYDQRSLKYATAYTQELLDVKLNISIDEMLDRGWSLMARHFEPFELGIRQNFIDKYWPKSLS